MSCMYTGGRQDTAAGHRAITSQPDLEASQDNWTGLDGVSCRVVLDVVGCNRVGESTDGVTRAQSVVSRRIMMLQLAAAPLAKMIESQLASPGLRVENVPGNKIETLHIGR